MRKLFFLFLLLLPARLAAQYCMDSIIAFAVKTSRPEFQYYLTKYSNGHVYVLTDAPFHFCSSELIIDGQTLEYVGKFTWYHWRKNRKNNRAIIVSIEKFQLGIDGDFVECQVQACLLTFKGKHKVLEPFVTVNICLRFNESSKKWEIMLC